MRRRHERNIIKEEEEDEVWKKDIHISYTSAFPKAKSTIAFKKYGSADNNIRKFRLKEQALGIF